MSHRSNELHITLPGEYEVLLLVEVEYETLLAPRTINTYHKIQLK